MMRCQLLSLLMMAALVAAGCGDDTGGSGGSGGAGGRDGAAGSGGSGAAGGSGGAGGVGGVGGAGGAGGVGGVGGSGGAGDAGAQCDPLMMDSCGPGPQRFCCPTTRMCCLVTDGGCCRRNTDGGAMRSCQPTGFCIRNSLTGPECGNSCCGWGEWCDFSTGTPTCRCGDGAACPMNERCCPSLSNQCGMACAASCTI